MTNGHLRRAEVGDVKVFLGCDKVGRSGRLTTVALIAALGPLSSCDSDVTQVCCQQALIGV